MKETSPDTVIKNKAFESSDKTALLHVFTVWYNRQGYVKESIESLFNQDLSRFVIIAVDDGSTDNTASMLKECAKKADALNIPMLVWCKTNQGFVRSIRDAINQYCEGEYLALHGAGDISERSRFSSQLQVFNQDADQKIVAVGCKVSLIDGQHKEIGKKNHRSGYQERFGEHIVPRLGTHGASMYRFKSYKQSGGYRSPFKFAQDTDLYLRLRNEGEFFIVDSFLYKKLVAKETVASKVDYKKSLEQIICSVAASEINGQESFYRDKYRDDLRLDELRLIAKKSSAYRRRVILLAIYYFRRYKIFNGFRVLSYLF